MNKLRRQFGESFIEALSKCPTLVADLAEIRANGVKIRKLGGHCQAYSNRGKKTIYIGARCKLSYKLISLAHEKVHVLVSPTPDPVPGKTSRQAFINMCLEAETDCIEHEVKVVAELLAARITVDDHSMGWYRRYQKGGRQAIREAMENAHASTTGEKYPEYYGGWYDEAVRPKDRLPFHSLVGDTLPRVTTGGAASLAPDLWRKPLFNSGDDICPRFRALDCEPPIRLDIPVIDTGKPRS